jgi:DNA-binding response OmpR family regulator
VEAQISRLRSKLSVIGTPEMMQTIRGEGYVVSATRSELLAS